MAIIRFWKNWTITTRIGAVISLGVVTGILVMVIGAVVFLKKEYLTTFGKQQSATVQTSALSLDADLSSKLKALTMVAGMMPPESLLSTSSAQQFLSSQVGLLSLFDDGLMILSAEGRILAEMPFVSLEREGKDYSASPFYKQAGNEARPFISEPFYSIKPGQRPVIEMMAPIHDAMGNISGYLGGGLTLAGDNVLGNIARHKVGNSGYLYLYSRHRTILIHPDRSRIMQKDVPPGTNQLFDRALHGFDGSGVTVNSRGLYFMTSFQHLQAVPWILAANLPMQEALTPFHATQRLIIVTFIISGVGVLLCSWWALFRFMAPLHRFIDRMKKCDGEHKSGPELTHLSATYNQMLARMEGCQAELRANEELQHTLLDSSPDIICFKDAQGRWLLANKAVLTLFHLEGVEYQGKKDTELAAHTPFYHDTLLAWELTDEKAWKHGGMLATDEIIPISDQAGSIFEITRTPLFHTNGERKAMMIIGRDINARRKDEEDLRKLSQAIEQCPVSIIITDTKGNIEFVNPQFSRLTGYTLAEVVGKNMSILKTDKTPPDVFAKLWQTISSGKVWEGDFYNQKRNGEQFIEHAIMAPIFNENGKITHYMAIKEDITARKQSEEIIWRQANFDTLTQLPNRRFFLYRLQNEIDSVKRDKPSLALLFLDLDHFKEVNDSLGHEYGDLLLIEAAQRILACVRDTDTVSRFGGDEFIVLLTNVKLDVGIGKVTKKIIDAMQQPFHLNNEVVSISVSIGSTTCPEDSTNISTLLRNADKAMYLAKNAGRNCWRSFTDISKTDSQMGEEHHVEI